MLPPTHLLDIARKPVENEDWPESVSMGDSLMQTVRVCETSGRDGVLHLRVPVGDPEVEYEAVIVLQPREAAHVLRAPEALDWPPGYFEDTFGSITDESFTRPCQGELPPAVHLG